MLGFNCNTFDEVHKINKSGMIVEFENTRGQKREIQPVDCLWLLLVWMRTWGLLNV
jgi:hypothetical protein